MEPLIKTYTIDSSLEEHAVWNNDIAPWLPALPENVKDIWEYAFTEMFNNAIEHSGGKKIQVAMKRYTGGIQATVSDDGVGIFNKIQKQLSLSDPRHAALELAKGKFTTDKDNHSGEGVFFTARMMGEFAIFSEQVVFSRFDAKDWIEKTQTEHGTHVVMLLTNNTSRTMQQIFSKFINNDDTPAFSKTIVPVQLAQYGDTKLVSRSQAKRLLAGLSKFDEVILDFGGVETIGQAFADEIFRVFAHRYPQIKLHAFSTKPEVKRMVDRALNHKN